MKSYHILLSLFAAHFETINGNGQGAIWTINPENEPRNIPLNGGIRVDFRQWDDGEPQTLTFKMRVPDRIMQVPLINFNWSEVPWIGPMLEQRGKGKTPSPNPRPATPSPNTNAAMNFLMNALHYARIGWWTVKKHNPLPTLLPEKLAGNWANTTVKLGVNQETYIYDAFLGIGEEICGAKEFGYLSLMGIIKDTSDPNTQKVQELGKSLGLMGDCVSDEDRRGSQSTAVHKDAISDAEAMAEDLEMQTACIFITCRGVPPGGFIARVTDKNTCPIEFVGSWRRSTLRPAIPAIKLSHLSEKVRNWTNIFWVVLGYDILIIIYIIYAIFKVCAILQEEEDDGFE